MITYNQFCNTFAVSVGSAVFEEVKRRAEHKRNYIISHFGDGNGARLTEASATNFAVKTAQQNFIKSQKRSGSDERTVTAYCS